MNRFLDLSVQTQNDIADALSDSVAKNVDVIEIERRLRQENPEIRLTRVPIEYIRVPTGYRVALDNVVFLSRLKAETAPPILRNGPDLVDGGHRILAAMVRQEKMIVSVDIKFLMERTWG